MMLFFANGGGNCYIISVGSYWVNEYPTERAQYHRLDHGPDRAADGTHGRHHGPLATRSAPTMTVVPEACQLDQGGLWHRLVTAMISQAALLQDRVAILDLPQCMSQTSLAALQAGQTNLALAIAPQSANLSYAAAYAPGAEHDDRFRQTTSSTRTSPRWRTAPAMT